MMIPRLPLLSGLHFSTPLSRARWFRGLAARLFAAVSILLGVAGCGGGDSGKAGDVSAPLEGREVGKANQLVGTWMRVSGGEYLGFEFLKDGKVLATLVQGGRTTTLDYSVLDGGRLSLVASGGGTTVFVTSMSGDLLELTREGAGAGRTATQRFRRVPAGKTLVAAVQEHAAEIAEERNRRYAALETVFAADDLVLVKAGESGPDAVIAVKFDHWQPNIGGVALMDDNPAKSDPLRPVRVHPLSGSVDPLDEFTNRIRIRLDVRPATAPAGQQDIQGQVVLIADGPIDRSTLTGTATFPKNWLGQADFVLKRDAKLHAGPTAKIEEERQATLRALARVSDPLGGRAILAGQKTSLGGGNPEAITMTIERVGEADHYTANVTVGTRASQAATGTLGAVIGQGALYVNLITGEQWRLHVDEAGKVFSGLWRPNTRADFVSSGNVELTLERSWTIAEVTAEREAIERYLTSDLRTPTAFTGFVTSGPSNDQEIWPVWVELQTNADGSAAGRAWLLGQNVGVELTGRLTGGVLNFQAGRALDGSANARSLMSQRWQLGVAGMEPQPSLTGSFSATMGGSGTVTLTPATPASITAARRQLVELLRGGAFSVVNARISRRPEPSYFRFDVDGSDAVSGDAVGADLTGSNPSALPPGLISGTIVEERGHPLVKLVVDGSPEPVRGRESKRFEYTVALNAHGESPVLTGWDGAGVGFQSWLQLTPVPAGTAIAVSDEQQFRLTAQRAGANIKAPDAPQAGEQALVLVHATERDGKVGQIFFSGGRYSHGNYIATHGFLSWVRATAGLN